MKDNGNGKKPVVKRNEKGQWLPGAPPNPSGRPKGAQHKITTDIRRYVFGVAEKLERNNRGLYEFAKREPRDFWQIFSKFIPKNVNVHGQVDVIHQVYKAFGEAEVTNYIPDLAGPREIDAQITDAVDEDDELVSDSA